MKSIEFIVYGSIKGKERPKFSKVGNFVKTYTPKETLNYESKVLNAFKEAQKKCGFEAFKPNEMVQAYITAYFKIPKTCYRYHKKSNTLDLTKEGVLMKQKQLLPIKKPDCDNIAKVVLDALNGVAYYDDSQIVILCVAKAYTDEEERVEVEFEGVDL